MKKLLFKPFEKYSETKLLTFGIPLTIVGLLIGVVFNARFDGVLDVHFFEDVSIITAILDFLIAIFCLLLFLFVAAKIVNEKTRFIDVLSTIIIARVPIYLLSFFNFKNKLGVISQKLIDHLSETKGAFKHLEKSEMGLLITASLASVLITIWYISLLYNGYKVSSNAKGTKSTVLFITALLLAEIVSKILIENFNK